MAKQIKSAYTGFTEKVLLQDRIPELPSSKETDKQMPEFFAKLNHIKDDRAFVIFSAIVLEYFFDKALEAFLPKYQELKDNSNFTFSLKISFLKSLAIIPSQTFLFSNLVRDTRNKFAHNLEIQTFEDLIALEDKNAKSIINRIQTYCKEYEYDLVYSKDNTTLKRQFKDVAFFAIRALKHIEPSIKFLRNEIEDKAFIAKVKKKSLTISAKKYKEFNENIMNYMQQS